MCSIVWPFGISEIVLSACAGVGASVEVRELHDGLLKLQEGFDDDPAKGADEEPPDGGAAVPEGMHEEVGIHIAVSH
jgi:hypothetical protein